MQHAYEVQAHVDTDKSSKGLAHTFLLFLIHKLILKLRKFD